MKLLISFFVFCTLNHSAFAQAQSKKFRSLGGDVGYATDRNDIGYDVYMLASDLSQSFKKPKHTVFLTWYCQPQFNIVKAATTPSNGIDVELGINLGIRNYIRVNDKFYLFQMLGSGPHFITADVLRQAKGFIFSDNVAIGSFIHLNKTYFLRLQAGLRHISNAGIKNPNNGIDSFLFMVGISGIR